MRPRKTKERRRKNKVRSADLGLALGELHDLVGGGEKARDASEGRGHGVHGPRLQLSRALLAPQQQHAPHQIRRRHLSARKQINTNNEQTT